MSFDICFFVQPLKCWPETIEKEDHVEKEVLQKLIDPSKVQFDTCT